MLRRTFMKLLSASALCQGFPAQKAEVVSVKTRHTIEQVDDGGLGLFCNGYLVAVSDTLYVNWTIKGCSNCGGNVTTYGIYPNQIVVEK